MGTLLAPAVILATASFPQLSRAAGAPDRFGADVRNALRPMMLIGALGSAGTYLFAQIVVEVVYGRLHYLPAVTILQVFSPVMFVLFVDVILGRALLAASRAKALAVVKVASVVVSTALDVVLIPWFQARHGNGGIGVVVAFALSELVVFAGVVAIMPRGVLRVETVVEAAKTIAAAAGTVLLLRSIPGLPPAAGIPLTVVVFFAVAFALRLIHRSDLALLGDMARRRYGPGVGHISADK
jgi:O-antigen/teichoic acid export membrane protein